MGIPLWKVPPQKTSLWKWSCFWHISYIALEDSWFVEMFSFFLGYVLTIWVALPQVNILHETIVMFRIPESQNSVENNQIQDPPAMLMAITFFYMFDRLDIFGTDWLEQSWDGGDFAYPILFTSCKRHM